jgi:hypothetical protein
MRPAGLPCTVIYVRNALSVIFIHAAGQPSDNDGSGFSQKQKVGLPLFKPFPNDATVTCSFTTTLAYINSRFSFVVKGPTADATDAPQP